MTEHDDALTRALAQQDRTEDCLPPETFLASEWAALSAEQVDRIGAHVAGCAMCQAEQRLAAAFDAPAALDELDALRGKRVLAQLDSALQPVTQAVPRRRRVAPFAALAAALALASAVLFVGLSERGESPPAPTMRGASVVLVAPQAGDTAPVTAFEWRALPGARRYELTVSDAVGNPVLKKSSTDVTLSVPAQESGWQRPGTTYAWQIDAFDDAGRHIGTSGPARFRVAPTVEDRQ